MSQKVITPFELPTGEGVPQRIGGIGGLIVFLFVLLCKIMLIRDIIDLTNSGKIGGLDK